MTALSDHKLRAVATLKRLIAIPSFSREEDKTAAVLMELLKEAGAEPRRTKNNVWALSDGFDESKPTILLNSHHDTVKPVSTWTADPFGAVEEDGKLVGLGSNDAGAALVCLMETFLYLNKADRDYNLVFLASAEEEVSGKDGVELALKSLPPIDLGIVGEPTEMNAAIAEKGLLVLDCTARGQSGHAAREEGTNALYIALEDIEKIRTLEAGRTSDLLGPVKMTVTQIQAGTQHNVVPDACTFVVDARTNESISNRELFDLLGKELKSEVTARSFRLNSSGIDRSHPAVKKAEAMGLKLYGSPTLSDQALMDFDTIKMGPGKSERSHTADEFVYLKEIEHGLDTYIAVLSDLKIKKTQR